MTSRLLTVADDVRELTAYSLQEGFGDGLPLVPPIPSLVEEYVAASGRAADVSLGALPSSYAQCTIEKVAANAVMAGALPESMPFLCSAILALLVPEAGLNGMTTTTNCVVPALIANGPIRDRLQIPYKNGCFGGAATPAVAIGRALRLIMRNIGGEVPGLSSKSTFGQPGRVSGIVVGEWEEESPWTPFAEREGVSADAVTVFGTVGTMDVVDVTATTGKTLAEIIGRSLTAPAQATIISKGRGQLLLAVCPPWARLLEELGPLEAVQDAIWREAVVPRPWFPSEYEADLEERDLFDDRGNVLVLETPNDLKIFVCGGTGSLHALSMPGFGPDRTVTRPVT
jgi:hypothetical protein